MTTALKHLLDLREMIDNQMFAENCTEEQFCLMENMFITCQSAIDEITQEVVA